MCNPKAGKKHITSRLAAHCQEDAERAVRALMLLFLLGLLNESDEQQQERLRGLSLLQTQRQLV